jgi:hypothetical protein
MNVDTGEIRSFTDEQLEQMTKDATRVLPGSEVMTAPDGSRWAPVSVGDMVLVNGARYRISYINEAKQRITIEPCRGEPGEVAK